MRSSIRLGAAALPREVAGGVPGDIVLIGMLGRHWLDINDPKLSPGPAGAVGGGLLGAGAGVHHVCGVQEDRSGMDIGVDLGEVWWMAERLS